MSKRLQVVLDESEWAALAHEARRRGVTLSEWVRQALRDARRREPGDDAGTKLQVIRAAATHSFPTAGIDEMLGEIESGYLE
ncbi:MAG: ribbon-helix-helix protein, CopG family [Actinobacteria bacterium]|nr:ribbon-helix-helix protein, CopG family [Actinomycetota bacterium]